MKKTSVGLLILLWLIYMAFGDSTGWFFVFGVGLAWETPKAFFLYGILLAIASLFVSPLWLAFLSIGVVGVISVWGFFQPDSEE